MDATEKQIVACAKSAKELGEPTVLTEVAGILITIHVGGFETAVGRDRFANLERIAAFPKGLNSLN